MAQPNGITPDAPATEPRPTKDTPPSSQPHKTPTTTTTTTPLPSTSLHDAGLSKRPRDARLIHMILANLGVTAYQERVPLQLMDFAYRYTSSTLQDALHLSSEGYGYGRGSSNTAAANNNNNNDLGSVSLPALRLSIASRLNYQFAPSLPKEFLMEVAAERNRVALPAVGGGCGVRLPPERYCVTGVGWGVRGGWESEGEDWGEDGMEGEGEEKMEGGWGGDGNGNGNGNGVGEEEEEGEGEGDERMEDVFGDGEGDGGGDRDMGDV